MPPAMPSQAVYTLESMKHVDKAAFDIAVQSMFEKHSSMHLCSEQEIQKAAIMYGDLLRKHLLEPEATREALRLLLQSLHMSPWPRASGKYFRFGFMALMQFSEHWSKWPRFCHAVMELPHLAYYPEVMLQLKEASK